MNITALGALTFAFIGVTGKEEGKKKGMFSLKDSFLKIICSLLSFYTVGQNMFPWPYVAKRKASIYRLFWEACAELKIGGSVCKK